jgi:acyl-CoA synthetase (AMP-forming)/AMP-acid ligase II
VEVDSEETAAILFTSGSTGVPKGVVYTHGIFATQVEAIRSLYDLQPGEIDLCTFPLFALFAPAFGWSAVVPDMDASRPGQADPVKILNAIHTFGVTNMFGSPALLERVGSWGAAHDVKLPTLQRVISAGAPVRPEVIISFQKLLSASAVIHTPYGATEALPVASITSSEIIGETRHATAVGAGVCVGRPVANLDLRIIRITDQPISRWSQELELPTREIGEIVVRGPQVTQSYYRRPDATTLSKIPATDGGPSWHRMGDVGYLDQHGRLWYCGRKTHRVITETGTLFTECCEAIFNRHPQVRRTALVGVGKPPQRPVLCIELRDDCAKVDRSKVLNEVKALGAGSELTRGIDTFLFHPGFPVDVRHNAKIFRERLAEWAAQRLR